MSEYVPYELYNIYNSSISPSTVHVQNTGLSWFFKKYLLQKAMSVFKFTVPENWDKDYFLYTLYGCGFIAVINTDKYGVIPQLCSLRGYNIYYRPTHAIISNPLFRGIKDLRIDTQCTVIKLQPNYSSIMDIVSYYGDMMALTSMTMGVNLLNSQLSYIFRAENRAKAETFKKMYDKIASGEPMVVIDKGSAMPDDKPIVDLLQQNVGTNFITPELFETLKNIEHAFDETIGIPNVPYEKKERLISQEVEQNNVSTSARADLWYETIQYGIEQSRKLFNIENLSCSWRVEPEHRKGDAALEK